MKALTAKQQTVLEFIHAQRTQHGMPPTMREIGAHLDLSSSCSAFRHVIALEKKGCVVRTPNAFRSLALTELGLSLCASPELPACAVCDQPTNFLTAIDGRTFCRPCTEGAMAGFGTPESLVWSAGWQEDFDTEDDWPDDDEGLVDWPPSELLFREFEAEKAGSEVSL